MKQTHLFSVLQIMLLVIVGIGIPGLVIWKNVFPTFPFRIGQENVHGMSLVEMRVDDGQYFSSTVRQHYPLGTIRLELETDQPSQQGSGHTVTLLHDHIANTYPLGSPISSADQLRQYLYQNNPDNLPNGWLFATADAVYLISRGKVYVFGSPEVFEALGYRWELVAQSDTDMLGKLQRGDTLRYGSAHPDGTIFKTRDGAYFLIWEQHRLPIQSVDLITEAWPTFFWIDIWADQPTAIGACQTQVTSHNRLRCVLDHPPSTGLGSSYLFSVDPPLEHISDGEVTFVTATAFEKNYLQYSLGQIKHNLVTRYAGKLSF